LNFMVSIHAPARGATKWRCNFCGLSRFNPRPRAGGDECDFHWIASGGFQSTPPRGGRPIAGTGAHSWTVSIHAPARGATAIMLCLCAPLMFQSTPPRGGRLGPHAP